MKRRIKLWMFILLILLQIVVNRHINELKLNLDLFFLILVYISIKSNFLPTILSATAIGLLTDFSAAMSWESSVSPGPSPPI